MNVMIPKHDIKKFLSENYLLLSILIGTTLVSLSIGPFQNGDTQWEYDAALGVIRWGIPYASTWGNIINQPPLGFYFEALFFEIFGASITFGTTLITLFGLGSAFLVYKIGKELYGKPTGLLAAALFALTPWELALSRSFLTDTQCLFFSLLCLYIGIIAIRKRSIRLSLLSGVFFAAALLTKDFAAFILIPLFLFYLYSRPKNPKLILEQLTFFSAPALLFSWLWYQVILGKGLLYMFRSSDFSDVNYSGVTVSPSFLFRFLWNYSLGAFFVAAVVFSLLVLLLFRKELPKISQIDLICVATILPILMIDLILGVGFNLKAPYTAAVKYDYQALPFFCLIAASLVGKCVSLLKSARIKPYINRKLVFAVVVAGVFLSALAISAEIYSAHQFATSDYLLYEVTPNQTNVGYSLFNRTPTDQYSFLLNVQYLGYVVLLSGVLWVSWRKIIDFFVYSFKPMHNWIEAKNAEAMGKRR
jgi:4-amino-4-deoxy-L-arabinose transferase-like glycosyltransferase